MSSNSSEARGVVKDATGVMSNVNVIEVVAVIANNESLALTRFIVQSVLVPIVTIIGFFGNVISICVLTRKSMVSSTNCYLTTLAVFDLMYLIFSFTLSLQHYDAVKEIELYNYWFPYGRVFTDICSNVSVCLTVTFSLERLIAVIYPMKGRIICTPERARLIIFIVTIFAVSCTSPEFCEWHTDEVTVNNETVIKVVESEMAKSRSYQIGYYYFITITFTILPVFVLTTCNGFLIKSVLAATEIRLGMTYAFVHKDTPPQRQGEQRITIMLIGVVVVFLVCQIPNAALILYTTYIDMQGVRVSPEGRNNIKIAGNIVNLLILINASINFVLYSVMSTKFRRVFLRLFCRFTNRYSKQNAPTGMTYYNTHTMRSPGSQIRFRTERFNTNRANGFIGGSQRSLYAVTHKSRSANFEDNTSVRSCPGQGSVGYNSSMLNQYNANAHTSGLSFRRICEVLGNEDLYQAHIGKRKFLLREGVMPNEKLSSETLEGDTVSELKRSELEKTVDFEITEVTLLPKTQSRVSIKGLYTATTL